jgi:predicted ATPase
MLILAPIPSRIGGESQDDNLIPNLEVENFAEWFSGLLAHSPSAYTTIDKYLKRVMPDLDDIKNPQTGQNSRNLSIQFRSGQDTLSLPFSALSDGEKCFFISALVLASNKAYGPLFCFWDEPDNYLSLSEVGHFLLELRRSFESGGQLLVTSHNPEAIRKFSNENTFLLHRNSHLEPTTIRSLENVQIDGDLIEALTLGDVEL